MSHRDLLRFFEAHKADNTSGLVLATVYDTLGSTYSKAGDRMLIAGNGDFQGMLSGGCLEGDLAERAARVASSGECQQVTYDLRGSDEELWGLGVGCEGVMRIFLQPLDAADNFEPFTTVVKVLNGPANGVVAIVMQSTDPAVAPGASLVGRVDGPDDSWVTMSSSIAGSLGESVRQAAEQVIASGQSGHSSVSSDALRAEIITAVLRPVPRVLVLGGDLDVEPVVRLFNDLGWPVTVFDHRPAYIDKGNFSSAERVICEPADALEQVVDLASFDAAIVMSHHLVSDRTYLAALATSDVAYVGLLGPRDRRRRLMNDLGKPAERLAARLHGPAGMPIGGRGPAAIALSIVAQMHAALIGQESSADLVDSSNQSAD